MRLTKSNLQNENISEKTWFPKLRDLDGTFNSYATGSTLLVLTNGDIKQLISEAWLVNPANDEAVKIGAVTPNQDGTVMVNTFPAFTTDITNDPLKIVTNAGLHEIKATSKGGAMTVKQINYPSILTLAANESYQPDPNDYGMQPVLITPVSSAEVVWG